MVAGGRCPPAGEDEPETTYSPSLGRIGNVQDVAGAVVFLACEQAAYITGQTVYVDGGLWSQAPWPYNHDT